MLKNAKYYIDVRAFKSTFQHNGKEKTKGKRKEKEKQQKKFLPFPPRLLVCSRIKTHFLN